MSEETQDITADGREYTLDELSKLADVTPRTVRYYIAEDLLPPPIVGGRNATYSQEHLDRLLAIGGLKAMYLPLREIRHRLNTLTPEQVRDPEYLATLARTVATERAMHKREMGRGMGRGMGRRSHEDVAESAADYLDRVEVRSAMRGSPGPRRNHRSERQPPMASPPLESPSTTWERFPLGDDAELLMRTSKAQSMGPRLHRMLHRVRHLIETEDNERNRS